MKAKYKYYKGILRCQYVTQDHQKLGATNYKQSKFKLEPRFRMEDVEIVEAEDYPDPKLLLENPYINSKENCDVEMSYKQNQNLKENAEVVKISEIFLFLENDNKGLEALDQKTEGGKYPIESYLAEKDGVQTYYSTFYAMLANTTHGKIKGIAYCKEIIYLNNGHNPNAGCFGGTDNLNAGGGATGSWDGCFGASNKRGCFSSGCFLPLLLLLLAALLSWLLNQGCHKQNDSIKVIHDTIKVEVIKDRIDTLTIVKSDTLSIVDSTTMVNYETVSLPNVQFYTNSDTLLPTSAMDLQKLAEYLIKNDSLSATIYGHTDKVGNPASNLQLSQRRAESVKRFLTSLGVQEFRLTAVGMGDKEPKGDNNTTEGRLMNRRVEVKLMQTEFVSTKRSKKLKNTQKDSTGLKGD